MDGTCAFTLDPGERTSHHDATLPAADLTDGVWTCPHDAVAGEDRCLAHLDDSPADIDETDWLLDAVDRGAQESQQARRRSKQFVGGRFRELDLASATVGRQDNHPLDFRYADIGTLTCVGLDLTRDIDLSMASVAEMRMEGTFDRLRGLAADVRQSTLDDAKFDRLDFRDATLGTLSFRSGSARTLDLRNAAADGIDLDGVSVERGQFDFLTADRARAHHATFDVVDFDNARFGSAEFYYADFDEADFRNVAAVDAVFKGTTFDGAYFNGVDIEVANWIGAEIESAHFTDAWFEQASFRAATVDAAGFPDCRFGWVNFQNADFEHADFSGSTFEQGVFRNATFESADFGGIDCAGALNLKGVVCGDIEIKPAPAAAPTDALVDLSDAELDEGVLAQSDAGRVIYDLEGATIGRIRFEGANADTELVRRIRFLRTRFEDFDFRDSDDVELKRTKYRLHEMFDGAEELAARLRRYGVALAGAKAAPPPSSRPPDPRPDVSRCDPSAAAYRALRARVDDRLDDGELPTGTRPNYRDPPTKDLEYTYLLAKNGANAIHDNESSSTFFVREMQQRRRRHAELAREAGTLSGWLAHRFDWLKNATLGLSAGYGERPARVIYTSAAIIGLFGLLYYALEPGLYENPLNFLVLSIGSFVTLLVGGVGDISITSVSLLTQIEAFVGGFLIAMFVFTLTRAIHR